MPFLVYIVRITVPWRVGAEKSKKMEQTTIKSPNIFTFTKSELSQDAMFAWLIQWADPRNKSIDESLHYIGTNFLCLLLGYSSIFIEKLKVETQKDNIDITVIINDDTFLVIEDKVDTGVHGKQLEEYKSYAEKMNTGIRRNIKYAYVKTGNENSGSLREIEKLGYRVVGRDDIIKCLKKYNGSNVLVHYYLEELERIENETQSWRTLPVTEWKWYAWQGFYKELENIISISGWDYVSNPSGGFQGAWWYFRKNNEVEMYLQFEEGKLCFKIDTEEKNSFTQSKLRDKYHSLLMSYVKDNYPEITRPRRFGCGTHMTIAGVDSENIFGTVIVNMDDLIKKLKEYQLLIDKCFQ